MIQADQITLDKWLQCTPDGSTYIGEKIGGKNSAGIIYIYSKDGTLFFILENFGSEIHDFPKTEGFTVDVRMMEAGRTGIREYFVVQCAAESYYKAFVWFAKDVCTKVLGRVATPRAAILETLEILKGFVQDAGLQALSKEEQYGLLCELLTLEKLLEEDVEKALQYWQLPDKLEQDFITPSSILEVKGTLRKIHEHTINGVDQLNIPESLKLFVCSFTLSEGAGLALSDAIESLDRRFFHVKPVKRKLFYKKLIARKYRLADSEEYQQFKFQIISSRIIPISNSTPRITRSSFKKALDPAISKIRYNLNFEEFGYEDFGTADFSRFL
jgi:hypothetical protein